MFEYLELVQNASKHTLQSYRTDVQKFFAASMTLAGRNLDPHELSEDLIRNYSEWLTEQGYRSKMI